MKALHGLDGEGSPPRSTAPTSAVQIEGLSGSRQVAVLQLLAAGATDEAIARRLSISVRTVQREVRQVLDLVGARTRFQAGLRLSPWLVVID
jgi:DNA-binding NarL/FixJ family response regulator